VNNTYHQMNPSVLGLGNLNAEHFNIDCTRRSICILKNTDLVNLFVGRAKVTNFPEVFDITSVHWDHWANAFCVQLISPSFEIVEEGARSPEFFLTVEMW